MNKYFLSACAIAKNEEQYLEEYVAFHLAVGFEHFYIYDNESKISVRKVLESYIAQGLVTVIDFPGVARQMPAYDHFLSNYGNQTTWALIADIDEYLVPISQNTVTEILTKYVNCNLQVSWRMFGSSGHQNTPKGLTIANYTKAIPRTHYENTHTKALIQPNLTFKSFSNPHYMVPKAPFKAIHPDTLLPVKGAWAPHSCQHLQLNHYFTRSLQEFKQKIQRPRADTIAFEGRKLQDFDFFDGIATETDECAMRFIDKTQKYLLPSATIES